MGTDEGAGQPLGKFLLLQIRHLYRPTLAPYSAPTLVHSSSSSFISTSRNPPSVMQCLASSSYLVHFLLQMPQKFCLKICSVGLVSLGFGAQKREFHVLAGTICASVFSHGPVLEGPIVICFAASEFLTEATGGRVYSGLWF